MDRRCYVCLVVLDTVCFCSLVLGAKRFGSFEGAVNFDGLSLDVEDVSKERCAIRYELSP